MPNKQEILDYLTQRAEKMKADITAVEGRCEEERAKLDCLQRELEKRRQLANSLPLPDWILHGNNEDLSLYALIQTYSQLPPEDKRAMARKANTSDDGGAATRVLGDIQLLSRKPWNALLKEGIIADRGRGGQRLKDFYNILNGIKFLSTSALLVSALTLMASGPLVLPMIVAGLSLAGIVGSKMTCGTLYRLTGGDGYEARIKNAVNDIPWSAVPGFRKRFITECERFTELRAEHARSQGHDGLVELDCEYGRLSSLRLDGGRSSPLYELERSEEECALNIRYERPPPKGGGFMERLEAG